MTIKTNTVSAKKDYSKMWDECVAELSLEDRVTLNAMIGRVVMLIDNKHRKFISELYDIDPNKVRSSQFGEGQAKELMIALLMFEEKHPRVIKP